MPVVWRVISVLVATIAVTIGLVGRLQPELFFRVPHIGFVLWAVTGHRMPPYFDERCWFREHWQGQPGDIVISTGAKAGTFWLHNIVLLLRTQGWDDFERMTDYYGNCEVIKYPEEALEVRLAEDAEKRRVGRVQGFAGFHFFTHYSPSKSNTTATTTDAELYGVEPRYNPHVKYLVLVRNGKEVIKSFYYFINAITQDVKELWGGFPPAFRSPKDAVKFVCDDYPQFYFGHLLAWWERKDLPNVLLLHYRNLRQNPAQGIRQIASFLDIPLTPELLRVVLHKSSLSYMSDPDRIEKYLLTMGYPGQQFSHVEKNGHIRREGGQLIHPEQDDHFFSDAMTARWEEALHQNFGHDSALMEFALHGVLWKDEEDKSGSLL